MAPGLADLPDGHYISEEQIDCMIQLANDLRKRGTRELLRYAASEQSGAEGAQAAMVALDAIYSAAMNEAESGDYIKRYRDFTSIKQLLPLARHLLLIVAIIQRQDRRDADNGETYLLFEELTLPNKQPMRNLIKAADDR